MARIEEITIYKFDELSERAKERARDWFREGDDFEFDTDDIEQSKSLARRMHER